MSVVAKNLQINRIDAPKNLPVRQMRLARTTFVAQGVPAILLTALLGGCSTTPPDTPPEPVETPPESAPAAQPPQPEVVGSLLTEARTAFRKHRFTTPADDNAYDRYRKVLAMDPGNPEAENGIGAIVEQYLLRARETAGQGRYDAASHYLDKATSIDPEHPNIPPLSRMIKDAKGAREKVFVLDRGQLVTRRVDESVLEAIVREILDGDSFVAIRAPDDASGRWIYQTLNRLTSTRVQASLEIGNPPAVTVTH